MRCWHSPRWSTSVWRRRTRARRSSRCPGAIHASGSRPTISNSRKWRASARSVLARFLLPRKLLVSAGSARCTSAPTAWSSSTTNRQPVVASSATSSRWPAKPPRNRRTPSRCAGVSRARLTSPVSVFSQSAVICARCWSSPITIATRGLLTLHGSITGTPCAPELRRSLHTRPDRVRLMPSFAWLRRSQQATLGAAPTAGGCCITRGLSGRIKTIRGMGPNFLECDRDQVLLLPPSLREWLPAGHLAWFVIDAVDRLDLTAFYAAYRLDGQGRAAHEPSMMVALLLYSYAVGERSSRRIERRCVEDVANARDLRQPRAGSHDDRAL